MRHVSTALLLAATLVACSKGGSTTSPDGPERLAAQAANAEGRTFEMKLGESVSLGGASGIRLTFKRVEQDSRCPIDAICVWTGDAEIALQIAQGSQVATAALHTHVQPRQTVWNGYTISLVGLTPAPQSSKPTDPAAYRAQLTVTR